MASVGFLFLRNVGDQTFGGEEEAGDGGGVLESAAGHLGWIDDACLDEVFILGGGDVVAVVAGAFLDFGNDESAFDACVGGKLTERSFDGASDDFSAGLFVTGETEVAMEA